ncbi:TonB-dependent receptor [Sphingomonas abietis]|uniref:TonB-dependent receptor n=1 Tax=Sphingomonas abietis TaxID=3012344 RepID=A0ABY7NIF8_9SPHN|nr:TonB-dependent receptor [Sphingomonas abietis]WBO21278.1 TonB-dependent receptor [Sphingomonas abietis]
MIKSTVSARFALLAAVSAASLASAAAAQTAMPAAAGPVTADPAAANATTPDPTATTTPATGATPDPTATPTVAEPGSGATATSEIIVTGIRASQQRAVMLKRDATSVTDSISAEDIGKLPDVTISDSLQRIPGVEIRRDAGEGSSINIRGLPEVTTLLNGEQYLGANSINSVQPNFNDVPSQLFSGADVIKSSTADLLDAGITGTVNLRTRRPFDLKRGITAAIDAEGLYGDKTKKKDPSVNGLIAWHGESVGFLLSAAYTDEHLSNSQNGILSNYGATYHDEGADATTTGGFSPSNRPHGTPVAGGIDINGDGDANDAFIVPQGFEAFNTVTERQRLGINGSAQWRISDSLELTADGFFTRQDQHDHIAGVQQQDINWQAAEFVPGASRDTGAIVTGPDGGSYHLNTVQVYNYDLGDFSSYSQNNRYLSQSQDYNIQLKYDNGGRFKASLRGIYGKAFQNYDQSYVQFSPSNGLQWEAGGIGRYPASLGGNRPFNPGGYTVDTLAGANSLHSTVDFSGSQPVFTLPTQLTTLLGDPSNYALKTMSSEGNYREKGDLKVIRADASYEANENLKFEFGGRYSERSNSDFAFDRAAPLYAGDASQPGGCLVKWKGFDVPINADSCNAGAADGYYTAGLTRPATDPSFGNTIIQVKPPANGLPGVYVLNPAAQDNAEKFQNQYYPGNVEVMNPGASYRVGVKQITGYTQMDFKGDLFGIPFAGNAGIKIINTRLDILQYITGNPQPYGVAGEVAGTTQTKRSFTDYLPSFNAAFDLTEKLKLRLAFTRTMTLLNLDQWGGGLTPNYAIDTSGATPVFRVTGGNSTGNPNLDPWRADNFDASLEWYVGRSSLLSVAAFYIKVDSFIQQGSVIRTDLPDNDGVVRGRSVSISTPIQGDGGTLKGLEGQWKQSFGDLSFMPHFLRNFGIDTNITFSPSNSGQKDLAGKSIPFQDNSKLQTNLVGYYQDNHFQARLAWNFRSKRAVSQDFGGLVGLELYQKPTNYLDASISYDLNSHFTVYAQGSNLTGEYEKYYLTWTDEHAYNNIYERRYTLGARMKF